MLIFSSELKNKPAITKKRKRRRSYIPFLGSLNEMIKAFSMSFWSLMNYNSPSFLPIRLLSLFVSLWGVVSSSRALNLTSPPPPFFTWPSPLLFPLSLSLSPFYSQESGSDIRCHSVPFPHYWADYQHAFTPAKKKKTDQSAQPKPEPVQPTTLLLEMPVSLPFFESLFLTQAE